MGPFHTNKWWGLYALFPLTVALLVFEHVTSLSPRGHAGLLMVIVLVIGVLARDWVGHNP